VHELAQDAKKSYLNIRKDIHKHSKDHDAIIVGYTSPILAIISRFSTTKRIYFNATSSQYEANIISRNTINKKTLAGIKWWLVDFLSFHLSTKVLLESGAQIDFVNNLFLVPKNKLILSFSGVSENDFFRNENVKKNNKFTVLFRGRFLPESGILTVIEAAHKLENEEVDFLIIGHGFLYREVNAMMDTLKPKNIKMINEKISIEDLRNRMQQCHISLGQLANHPRLDRTLPCKLFESLALGLPYLTGRNKAALEILEDGKTCITVNPGDPDDLVKKILELKKNRETLTLISEAGYNLYKEKLTSEKLAFDVLESCSK
jgi:glycosyltransferase involved in cell wall biosynthesis